MFSNLVKSSLLFYALLCPEGLDPRMLRNDGWLEARTVLKFETTGSSSPVQSVDSVAVVQCSFWTTAWGCLVPGSCSLVKLT